MKKLLSLCLALLLAGCSAVPSPATSTPSAPPSSSVAPSSSSPATDASDGSNTGIEVEKGFGTVTITVPVSMFEGGDAGEFDANAYAKEYAFDSAVIQLDGTVTISMSKTRHNELLREMQKQVSTLLEELKSDPNYPFIKKVDANSDFTKVTVSVDKEEYESTFNLLTFAVTAYIGAYQVFAGDETATDFKIIDEATQKVIYEESF